MLYTITFACEFGEILVNAYTMYRRKHKWLFTY